MYLSKVKREDVYLSQQWTYQASLKGSMSRLVVNGRPALVPLS